jgi:hypothetical protein
LSMHLTAPFNKLAMLRRPDGARVCRYTVSGLVGILLRGTLNNLLIFAGISHLQMFSCVNVY